MESCKWTEWKEEMYINGILTLFNGQGLNVGVSLTYVSNNLEWQIIIRVQNVSKDMKMYKLCSCDNQNKSCLLCQVLVKMTKIGVKSWELEI